jgi:SAM-dependent methyltransferase
VHPGFKRGELRSRYDIANIHEDEWHTHCGVKTAAMLKQHLGLPPARSIWLLNAGAGIYSVSPEPWREAPLDLFLAPLRERRFAVCANVESLPFPDGVFGGIVCVGEVLGYCDPALAIREFARVLVPSGILICDFASSRSFGHWLRRSYGRAADLVTDWYNGTPERTWAYDPKYLKALLQDSGFHVKTSVGTHCWSALFRRLGVSVPLALCVERSLQWIPIFSSMAYLTTIVAFRHGSGR